MTFTRNPIVYLNAQAIKHNLQRVRDYAPNSRVLAMVKANAYGHDIEFAVRHLQHADAFGVACMQEARVIRQFDTDKMIVLIEGVCNAEEWRNANTNHMQCVIHHHTQLDFALAYVPNSIPLNAQSSHTKPTIWLKINTGMNRLGFFPDDAVEVAEKLHQAGYTLILTTHFANADEIQYPSNAQQKHIFFQLKQRIEDQLQIKLQYSMANSACILSQPDTHGDWVRAGLMLYGSSPFSHLSSQQLQLQPVMTFTTNLINLYTVNAGESIGYGATFTTAEALPIGIIAVGYGDGYPRVIQHGAVVLQGHKCAILGRVSMDMIAIDLSQLPHTMTPKIGDVVTLWGDTLPVEEVAVSANTISYELFCRLTTRATRRIIDTPPF